MENKNFKFIDGTVTSPLGFTAQGVCASIKPSNTTKRDLALIYCEKPCSAAAVYTKNLVKSSTIQVTKKHLENGIAQAVIVNSGNANTCNADGVEVAEKMCKIAAETLSVNPDDVIVASTGVIGQPLPIETVVKGAAEMKGKLSKDGGTNAAEAIMTTDTVKKEMAMEMTLGGKKVTVGGIAKGSGMIHINMGTMLSFVTTDAAVSAEMLECALREAVEDSYNMVSVDGDTSTNDTLAIMASGLAGNEPINEKNEHYKIFVAGLTEAFKSLAKQLAGDGEGATKLLVCTVDGAKTKKDAVTVSKSIICSSLLKAAMFGADANWGRVLCAIGYSGADVDVTKVDVSFQSCKGEILVCKDGAGVEFSEEKAKEILLEKEINILVSLNDGDGKAEAYGCDLTYDYVKINGDYRT
ncbi:bifunctional glutamate N-acetyltransferase/amino-acid acetyltransferase ArgJ [Ruminococcus sp.]|uniref:bifunctional glutamate N-acetyltransferase/amino-acid acetyltransferase ArgJ n=1 Tax=Ruminococcus sp. TaxID=41978 RepID=UPI002637E54A|nr:bifunctional glutamate N-acetyltransferase/amino-acid acetyltransferase ArgJ [Ruminococcus sp.]MDD6989030.1 bifunctional glutamate N-acetyltransferase/amino-acid acetyltransferase ArgJ [Ruminococcus sp.]MDY6201219.1 bifunctional glutamate N-acetyltransferase/amino-acid acetyltransferase ArgJ [Ruminococcus sp.]